jgi:hypothetical protein
MVGVIFVTYLLIRPFHIIFALHVFYLRTMESTFIFIPNGQTDFY